LQGDKRIQEEFSDGVFRVRDTRVVNSESVRSTRP